MLINFAVAFLVSAFTPAPPQAVQEMVENIHIPSGRVRRRIISNLTLNYLYRPATSSSHL